MNSLTLIILLLGNVKYEESRHTDITGFSAQYKDAWATETVGDAAYPLKLFQRVITVSIETMKIVKALPKLNIA